MAFLRLVFAEKIRSIFFSTALKSKKNLKKSD